MRDNVELGAMGSNTPRAVLPVRTREVRSPGARPFDKGLTSRRLMLMLCVYSICSMARADIVTLLPAADSYIRELMPDLNAGGEQNLVVGCLGDRANREIRRAFMRFDLTSQIPAGAIINSAALNLTVVMVPLGPADSTFQVRRVLSPWSEADVTWNSRLAGILWQSAGAEGPADTSPNLSSSVLITGLGTYMLPSTAALVTDVQAWVNNPSSNFGWIFESQDELTPKTARRFGSREDPFNTPVLTVDFSVPSLSVVVQPSDQSTVSGSTVTFNAVVSGTPPFTYQWFFNSNVLAGQFSDTLTLTNVQVSQSGFYSVTVSNSLGSVTSAPVTLTVTNLPAGVPIVNILTPTDGSKFAAHSDVTFVATATETNGSGTITNADFFLFGTNPVGSSTTSPYTVTLSNLPSASYFMVVTARDDLGSNGSATVRFSVVDPPGVFFTAPQAGRVALGTAITITASVVTNGARVTEADFYAVRFDPTTGGFVTNLIGVSAGPVFTNLWTPSIAGDYALSVLVQDELGQTNSSTNLNLQIFLAELIPPIIAITSAPPNLGRITSDTISISGIARDNIGLDHIEYQLVTGPLLQRISGFTNKAAGTTNWSAQVHLFPGKNAVQIRSVDLANNRSSTLTRYYTYFATGRLTIETSGGGAVVPDLTGQDLVLGRNYTLTARAAPGFIFGGWQNVTPTNIPTITFELDSSMSLVANFVTNQFIPLAGEYAGLFFDPNPLRLRPEAAGFLSFHLNGIGRFSGKLMLGNASFAFGGTLDLSGHAQVGILRPALSPLSLSLTVSLDPNAAGFMGTFTSTSGGALLSVPITGVRNPFNAQTNPAPQAGRRSFVLELINGTTTNLQASAIASITKAGQVTFNGTLEDKRPFNRGSSLGLDGTSPFFLSFAKGTEIFIGWANFGTGTNSTASGEVFHTVSTNSLVEVLDIGSP